jgi:tetratricopeptide (TPR) repeat protein
LELLSNSDIAAKTSGNQIAARLREAHLLENDHKSSEADELYQKLLVDHPEVDAAWLGLGISHANLSLVDAADSDFRRFLSSHPDSPSAHLYLGKILLRKKRPEEARRELLQSKQLDPLLLEARLGIAASFITQARYSEAIAELRAAEKLPAHPPELRLMLAEALYKNLDSPAALRELELLLKEDPKKIPSILELFKCAPPCSTPKALRNSRPKGSSPSGVFLRICSCILTDLLSPLSYP